MAAYGLYTHIQSNKRRSIALLIGLFFLVYVMVFAGALLAEALMLGDAPLDYLLRAAWRDFDQGRCRSPPPAPCSGSLIAYHFHQSMIDAVDRRRARSRARRSRGSTICWKISASRAASPCRSCKHRRRRRAQRLRHRPQREAIFHHGDARPARRARRPRDRGRARPRAHPYPQRRRAHAGDRRDHRRRDRVLRRADVPHVVPGRLRWRRPRGGEQRATARAARGIAILIAIALIAVAWLLSIVIRFALSR